jgi:hypothetical protein
VLGLAEELNEGAPHGRVGVDRVGGVGRGRRQRRHSAAAGDERAAGAAQTGVPARDGARMAGGTTPWPARTHTGVEARRARATRCCRATPRARLRSAMGPARGGWTGFTSTPSAACPSADSRSTLPRWLTTDCRMSLRVC